MSYKTIVLKGDPLQKEGKVNTGSTVYPGMLLDYVTNDATIRPHPNSGQNAAAMVAIENSLEGEEVGDSYAADDQYQYVHLRPGDEFLALIADGQNVSFGDFLESNGDGYFKVHTPSVESSNYAGTDYQKSIVAKALEALNASSSGVSATRIKAVAV